MQKDIGLLVLRLGIGLLMLFGHGLAKLTGFDSLSGSFPDPIGVGAQSSLLLAVLTEVFFSVLLALGLLSRPAALGLLTTMLVAAFIVHGDDPFARKEMALLYALSYITLLLTGPGRFSLDAFLHPMFKRSPLGRLLRP